MHAARHPNIPTCTGAVDRISIPIRKRKCIPKPITVPKRIPNRIRIQTPSAYDHAAEYTLAGADAYPYEYADAEHAHVRVHTCRRVRVRARWHVRVRLRVRMHVCMDVRVRMGGIRLRSIVRV